MSMSVLNNLASLQAQNELTVNSMGMQKTLNRLSTGKRLNTGADDAAGLAIADGLLGQINALNQASRNASDGVGYLQVADGAMSQITNLLHRAITLAEQAATSTNADSCVVIDSEYQQIKSEIDRIYTNTNYNGTDIFATTLSVFVGDTTSTSVIVASTTSWSLSSTSLSLGNLTTTGFSTNELAVLREALDSVAGYRGEAGAVINRLRSAQNVILTQVQNLTTAESQIRDANMAEEVSNLTKFQILAQSGMAALGQANSNAQNVLQLLRG